MSATRVTRCVHIVSTKETTLNNKEIQKLFTKSIFFHYLVMMSSIPFLVITFFIYAFISEIRNLHGKCLMSYVFSFAILYATSSVIELNNKVLLEQHTEICTTLGYLWMTAILCCCFWSNVMCYDIWMTFKYNINYGQIIKKKNLIILL